MKEAAVAEEESEKMKTTESTCVEKAMDIHGLGAKRNRKRKRKA